MACLVHLDDNVTNTTDFFSIERKALDKDLTEGRLAPEKVAILDIVISFIEV